MARKKQARITIRSDGRHGREDLAAGLSALGMYASTRAIPNRDQLRIDAANLDAARSMATAMGLTIISTEEV